MMDVSSLSSDMARNDDDASSHFVGSVASSTFSNLSTWSSALADKLAWLRISSENCNDILSVNTASSVFREKQRELRVCLNGKDEEVNLWELREHALTRGGLLSTATRRRAWPKLMGIHQDVLMQAALTTSNNKTHSHLEVSTRDLQLLEQDLQERVEWSIENQVHMARKQQAEEDAMENMKQQEASPKKRVSFASTPPKLQGCTSEESSESPPVMSITTLTTSPSEEETLSPRPLATLREEGEASPLRNGALQKKNIALSLHEQAILRNLVVSVLRTPPPLEEKASSSNHQDGYSYFSGLHNLAALLLINLESPSLTSLILKKLATFHLHDAMTDVAALEKVSQLAFGALLHEFDPVLYDHVIVQAKMISLAFVTKWIMTWFVQDVNEDVRIASRLVDVCLASHALMPIYLSLAIMTLPENRELILSTPCNDGKSILMVLQNLPVDMIQHDDPTEAWEDVVEAAVLYIRRVPPSHLKELILVDEAPNGLQFKHVLSTAAVLDTPPSWTVLSTAPTDWALLQQAKQLRMKSKTNILLPAILQQQDNRMKEREHSAKDGSVATRTIETSPNIKGIQESYPTALAASGLVVARSSKRAYSWRLLLILGVLFIGTGVSLLSCRGQSGVQTVTSPIIVDKKEKKSMPTKQRKPKMVELEQGEKPQERERPQPVAIQKPEPPKTKERPKLPKNKKIESSKSQQQPNAVAVKPSRALQVRKPPKVVESGEPESSPFVSTVIAKAVEAVTVDPSPVMKEKTKPSTSNKDSLLDSTTSKDIIPSLVSKLGLKIKKIKLFFLKRKDPDVQQRSINIIFGNVVSFFGRLTSEEIKKKKYSDWAYPV